MSEQAPPTVGASVQMKINLGNYESADAFLSIQNITADTTSEEMERSLTSSASPTKKLRDALREKVRAIRAEGQQPTASGWR